jgi:hypothetical protein
MSPLQRDTTPGLAEKAKEQAGEYGEIIELETDSLPKHEPDRQLWMVWMARDGKIQVPPEHISAFDNEEGVYEPGQEGWTFKLWARDREHAVKSANEKRAMLIAQPNVKLTGREQPSQTFPLNPS